MFPLPWLCQAHRKTKDQPSRHRGQIQSLRRKSVVLVPTLRSLETNALWSMVKLLVPNGLKLTVNVFAPKDLMFESDDSSKLDKRERVL
ncbi:Cytochrome c oxidase copper chaperone like [Actinidia chinensis var. chinensis]|uniref:Cytochrome c oxidase copper chaperone like n=1 Tax=Actinidia chinensis var. chinensis TaxID=1590841 RepID=A0A2R6PRN1_ACTCC|nr:Cytochrome c oxidase copper chaperone like [Actinidia chinensis var. chinensis]